MSEKKRQERRYFSPEFKIEAVRRAEERKAQGVPLTQIARELSVTDHMLREWRRKLEASEGAAAAAAVSDVFPGQGRLPSDQEAVRKLERENARLRQEVAFLKSAAAYFAKESR